VPVHSFVIEGAVVCPISILNELKYT
jgi:hypothetical protein